MRLLEVTKLVSSIQSTSISTFAIMPREEYKNAVEGFPGSLSRQYSKKGKALKFVENNGLHMHNGVISLHSSTTTGSSGSAANNRNGLTNHAATVDRPISNFIEGHGVVFKSPVDL